MWWCQCHLINSFSLILKKHFCEWNVCWPRCLNVTRGIKSNKFVCSKAVSWFTFQFYLPFMKRKRKESDLSLSPTWPVPGPVYLCSVPWCGLCVSLCVWGRRWCAAVILIFNLLIRFPASNARLTEYTDSFHCSVCAFLCIVFSQIQLCVFQISTLREKHGLWIQM